MFEKWAISGEGNILFSILSQSFPFFNWETFPCIQSTIEKSISLRLALMWKRWRITRLFRPLYDNLTITFKFYFLIFTVHCLMPSPTTYLSYNLYLPHNLAYSYTKSVRYACSMGHAVSSRILSMLIFFYSIEASTLEKTSAPIGT